MGAEIGSYCHKLVTEAVNKIALSAYDNKHYTLNDSIATLAYDIIDLYTETWSV